MTYIEIIKKGKRNYYYITKNIRIAQNKWKKVRIYIGNKKPSKNEISKYVKEQGTESEYKTLYKSNQLAFL